jgi:hypothetical protein
MNQKMIIALIISGVILSALVYCKYKKPCPCKNKTPEQAIDAMSDNDLRDQIKGLNATINVTGKTNDQLKTILKELIK